MNRPHKQAGFGAVEVVLIVVLVAVVCLVGWRVYDTNKTVNETSQSAASQSTGAPSESDDVAAPQSAADVAEVDQTLEQLTIEDDSSEIDNQLEF